MSGAHAYGFPSPDSDLDLKAIHIEPTARLLGLAPPTAHADRMEVIDGVEIDYTSNELGRVLRGILQGNGNYLERVLGALSLRARPSSRSCGRSCSGRCRADLSALPGLRASQLHAFDNAAKPTAKKLLYVLRTALTGMHLLRSGKIVTDVTALVDEYGCRRRESSWPTSAPASASSSTSRCAGSGESGYKAHSACWTMRWRARNCPTRPRIATKSSPLVARRETPALGMTSGNARHGPVAEDSHGAAAG